MTTRRNLQRPHRSTTSFSLVLATGNGFSIALSSSGDLYCAGDNSMGQCPNARGGRSEVFVPLLLPDLTGTVADVKAGAFDFPALAALLE